MYEDLEASAQIGQVLAGKYRVDRVLGIGGMGVVVAATHLQLDQIVALKFIRREALSNYEVVSRFEREARSAVRLKSAHVARIIDVGRLETGSPFIVMEYLEGQDLGALIKQYGKLTVAAACDFVIQACDAMAEAHRLGIVHRDLKPGNLFLANSAHGHQTLKVLDFGISKSQAGMGDASMTQTQAVMGSPGYMSPEQMRSTKNVDARSDLWSLGVILYELVAGRPPFQADTFTALCVKIAMDPHPPLPLPSTPAGFDAVVNRALEKDQTRRFQSAEELALALAPFAEPAARERAYRLTSGDPAARASGSYQVAAAAFVETTLGGAAGQPQTRPGGGRRRTPLVVGIAAGAAVVVGLAIALTRPSVQAGSEPSGEVHKPIESAPLAGAQPVRPAPVPPPPPPVAPAPDAGVAVSEPAAAPDAAAVPAAAIDARPKLDDHKPRPKVEPEVKPFDSPD